MAISYIKKQVQEPKAVAGSSAGAVQSGDIDIDTSADHIGDDDMPTESELKLMREFTYQLKPKDKDQTLEAVTIHLNGCMPEGYYIEGDPEFAPPKLVFRATDGPRDSQGRSRKCVVYGGLPDVLLGETNPAYRIIHTGSRRVETPTMTAQELASARAIARGEAPLPTSSTFVPPTHKTVPVGGMNLPAEMFVQAEQTDLEQAGALDHTKVSTAS